MQPPLFKISCKEIVVYQGLSFANFSSNIPMRIKFVGHVAGMWDIQGDQKVSVHLMITIQKVTSNVQIVPYQSQDFY